MSPTATQRTLLELKPSDIVEHPDNPRQAVGDVTDLAKSIAEHGIYEPLVVAPWPADLPGTPTQKRKHLLIAGARRLAGAKKAKQDTVSAILRSDLDTRPRQIEAMLIENLQRVDLTPVEEGRAYQGLLDLGLTQKQLAQELGQPATRVRDRLKLAKLDEPVQARLHAGQITITDALAIDEFRDDAAATKELMGAIGGNRFEFTLRQQRAERDHARATAARAAALKAAGVDVKTSWPKKAVDLRDVFPNGPGLKLVYPYGDERDAWVIANHKDCPGHVTAIAPEEYSNRKSIRHGCTEPSLHPKTPPKSKAQLEREKKDRARKAQAKIDLAAAADLRNEHLAAALETLGDAAKRLVHSTLVGEILREHYGAGKHSLHVLHRTADLLGIDPDDAGEPSKPSERLSAAVRALGVLQLVLLRMLIDETDAERRMLTPPDGGGYGVIAYAQIVDALGYEWTPVEKAQFGGSLPNEEPAAIEETPAADASTDDEPRPVEDHELRRGAVAYETSDVDDVEQAEVDQ